MFLSTFASNLNPKTKTEGRKDGQRLSKVTNTTSKQAQVSQQIYQG
jgi:hypothetical protein